MPDGNGATIDVDDIRIPAHIFVDSTGLRGERFVGFNQI